MHKIFLLKFLIVISCFYINASVFAFPPIISNAIYNGDKVMSDAQFPFVVGIYDLSLQDLPLPLKGMADCTGSIISKSLVLTAGHCVVDEHTGIAVSPDTLLVGTGYLAVHKAKAEQILHVKKIFILNNKWDSNYDIALLQLAETTDIQPVKLPSPGDFPDIKTNHSVVTAVGYGYVDQSSAPEDSKLVTRDENDIYADSGGTKYHFDVYLHYANKIIQNDQMIEKLVVDAMQAEHLDDVGVTFNPVTMLGVTSPTGNRATQGDSGGPLLLKDSCQQYVQIGVNSWSPRTSDPSIFANLLNREMLDFINNTMKNNS